MRALIILVAATALGLSGSAHAQSVPLPRLDSISFFGEAGDFEGHAVVDSHTYGPLGTFGWGFETAFTVIAKTDYLVELAVSYDELFERARLGTFVWTGEVRNLPGTTLYVTFRNGLYVGVATGVTSLAHTSIDNGTARYSVGGDTFDFAPSVGYSFPFQDSSLDDRRVDGFVEVAYHVRYFGGLDYGPGAPADLPSSIYLGGFALCAGVQIAIGAKAAITATPTADAKK